jgi:hypothetical protein
MFSEPMSDTCLRHANPMVDFLLGHQTGSMSQAYKELQPQKVMVMYVEHAHLLSVVDHGPTLRQVQDIENKVEEKVKAEARNWYGGVAEENVRLIPSLLLTNSKLEKIEKVLKKKERLAGDGQTGLRIAGKKN